MTCTRGGNTGRHGKFDKGKIHQSGAWDDDPDPDAEAAAALSDSGSERTPTAEEERAELERIAEDEAAAESVPDGETVPDEPEGDDGDNPLAVDEDEDGVPLYLLDGTPEPSGKRMETAESALARTAAPLDEPDTSEPSQDAACRKAQQGDLPGEKPVNRGHFQPKEPDPSELSHKHRTPKERKLPSYAKYANPAGKGFEVPKDRIAYGQAVMAGERHLEEPSVLTSPYVLMEVLFCVAHMPRQRPKAHFPMVGGQRTSFKREVWREGRFSGGFAVDPGVLHFGGPGSASIVPDGVLYGKWARLLPMLLFTHARMFKDPWVPLGRPSQILNRHFPGQEATGGSTGNLAALNDNLIRLVANHMQMIHNHHKHKRLTLNSSNVSLIKSVKASADMDDEGNPLNPVVEAVRVDDAVLDDSLTAMLPVDRELLFSVADQSSLTDTLLFIIREGNNISPGKKRRIPWKDIHGVFYPDAPTMTASQVRNRFRKMVDALRHRRILGRIPIDEYKDSCGRSLGIELGHIERIVPGKSDRNRMLSDLSKSGEANERTVGLVRDFNEGQRAKKTPKKSR